MKTYADTLDLMQTAFRPFVMIAAAIPDADVKAAREAVNKADAFGSIVDPTAYRTALADRRLERQRRLIDLFDKTTQELKLLFPENWPELTEK